MPVTNYLSSCPVQPAPIALHHCNRRLIRVATFRPREEPRVQRCLAKRWQHRCRQNDERWTPLLQPARHAGRIRQSGERAQHESIERARRVDASAADCHRRIPILTDCRRDSTRRGKKRAMPPVLVIALASLFLLWANRSSLGRRTSSAAGIVFAGSAVAIRATVLLSLRRADDGLDLDLGQQTIEVQAGGTVAVPVSLPRLRAGDYYLSVFVKSEEGVEASAAKLLTIESPFGLDRVPPRLISSSVVTNSPAWSAPGGRCRRSASRSSRQMATSRCSRCGGAAPAFSRAARLRCRCPWLTMTRPASGASRPPSSSAS